MYNWYFPLVERSESSVACPLIFLFFIVGANHRLYNTLILLCKRFSLSSLTIIFNHKLCWTYFNVFCNNLFIIRDEKFIFC